jgi:hypothetical protein
MASAAELFTYLEASPVPTKIEDARGFDGITKQHVLVGTDDSTYKDVQDVYGALEDELEDVADLAAVDWEQMETELAEADARGAEYVAYWRENGL